MVRDGSRCVAWAMQARCDLLLSHGLVRLCGLDAGADYRLAETGEVYGDDELMHIGLATPYVQQDSCVTCWTLVKCEQADAVAPSSSGFVGR